MWVLEPQAAQSMRDLAPDGAGGTGGGSGTSITSPSPCARGLPTSVSATATRMAQPQHADAARGAQVALQVWQPLPVHLRARTVTGEPTRILVFVKVHLSAGGGGGLVGVNSGWFTPRADYPGAQ